MLKFGDLLLFLCRDDIVKIKDDSGLIYFGDLYTFCETVARNYYNRQVRYITTTVKKDTDILVIYLK